MLKIPENVYFICGMHGSGKTTLCREFLKLYPEIKTIYYQKCEMTSFQDVFERQLRRIARFGIDYYRINQLAKENPDAIILCDRCIYDGMCYVKAFHKLKYISQSEYQMLWNMVKSLWGTGKRDQIKSEGKCVFLFTPFAQIRRNLAKRQKLSGPKWNEKNMHYGKVVWQEYNHFFEKQKSYILIKSKTIEENVQRLKEIILQNKH